MTVEIAYVLALLVVALVLFAWEILSVDVAALLILLAVTMPPGLLTPEEALAGFGSETILVLIALFVLTAGLTRTGVIERLGRRIATLAGGRPAVLTRTILVSATALSSFISNTVTTAVMLPVAIGSARRAKISVSKILMPLAFASILAGAVTLIGTTTNLVVSGEMVRHGLDPIGFFEMAPVGLGITLVGLAYLAFFAPRLVPDRTGVEVVERYGLRTFFSEVVVPPGSSLAGKSLEEARLAESTDLHVVGIRRGRTKLLSPRPSTALMEGDVILVEGRAEDILSVKDAGGVEIRSDFELSDPDLVSDEVRMVEAMVLPRSRLAFRTLARSRFRRQTGLAVLGIHSGGRPSGVRALSTRRLEPGDVLLLQGRSEDFERIDPDDLLLLEDRSAHHPRSFRAGIAAATFAAAAALAASGLLPLSIAFLAGVPVLILTRCLTPQEAYESVDWRLLVLIGSMMAFGAALQKSGAADFLADLVMAGLSPMGGHAILAGFFLLTVLLTQPMSNQAAALVVLPVAFQVAARAQLEPRALALGIAFAASCSFLTPLEPACLLVYGPGNYRFLDFVRAGSPLTLLVFAASMLLIPLFWPLQA
jgi:di/tricarboxylate transporter